MTHTFVFAPSFESPTEVASYLLERGCDPEHWRIFLGPDRRWRGSGRVALEERTA